MNSVTVQRPTVATWQLPSVTIGLVRYNRKWPRILTNWELPFTMSLGELITSPVSVCCLPKYRSVPQIRPPPPPFCNLRHSTKCKGGLYAGCNDFSRDYTLPSGTGKAQPHCRWGVGAKRETSPSARQRDAPDATGRLASFSVEGQGSRALPRSNWRVHRWCGHSHSHAIDTLTVDSRVA